MFAIYHRATIPKLKQKVLFPVSNIIVNNLHLSRAQEILRNIQPSV
jgi:hypothetical protein